MRWRKRDEDNNKRDHEENKREGRHAMVRWAANPEPSKIEIFDTSIFCSRCAWINRRPTPP